MTLPPTPTMMDVRGHLAEALFERLEAEGIATRVLAEGAQAVVPRPALALLPRRVARFAQELDLHLVHLARSGPQGWRFLLAWSDELGRPSFLELEFFADYFRAGRRLLRAEELLAGGPDVLFLHGLLDMMERGTLSPARGASLHALWHADPRGAIERVGRVWRNRGDIRLIAQAAKHGAWPALEAALPRLRRRLRRSVWPTPAGIAARLRACLERAARPEGATVAFVGAEQPQLRERVARDLAPAGIIAVGEEGAWRAPLAVALGNPGGRRRRFDELIAVDRAQALPAAAATVERALLRWLECRLQRRFPDAMVGANPLAARLLQFACRYEVPLLAGALRLLLNCGLHCRVPTPILMPYPYGIVIHPQAVIGSRVTVLHQVTIGARRPGEREAPVIEDNVLIGAGAKILGGVRVGRGATVGANAVVTRDVPSHCTVVGVNRIVGAPVADGRQEEIAAVVNT